MELYCKVPNYPSDFPGKPFSSLTDSEKDEATEIYYSNRRLELFRERHYRDWCRSDPPREPLIAFQIPHNSIGHYGFRISKEASKYEMERMKIILVTESKHLQLKQKYEEEQKENNLFMGMDST